VTQVPALVISVAAALLITKNSGSEGFGQDILRQLLRSERVFYVAAVFLLVLLPSGLPKAGLILGATVCAIVGLTLARNAGVAPEAEVQEPEVAPAKPRPSEEAPGDAVRSLLAMEPIELEIGYRLVGLVDEARGGDLMGRLAAVRERIALDIGLVVPPVKVRDNTLLHPGEYNVKLRGNSIGCWRVYPGMTFVVTEGEQLEALDGIPGTDPATGLPGLWAKEPDALIAARSGFSTRNIPEIVTEHLGNLIRVHAGEILTRVEVSRLVGDLRGRAPALVDELIPGVLKIGDIHRVLQSLLREQVSIRNLELILETLADNVAHLGDPAQMTECVRRALARTIGSPLAARDGVIHAALLDPALEEFLQSSLERGDNGSALNIGPEVADTLVDSIAKVLMELERLRFPSVLVCSSKIRAHIRNLMARRCPQAAVLSYDEVKDDFRLEVHGNVALEAVH
jgi:flagellar biosynthesis protein FlhA